MSAPLGFVRGAGNNTGLQLGTLGTDKTTVNQTRLMVVVVPVTVTAVAAGEEHSLALGADGTVWTCGVVLKSRHKNPVKVSGSSRSSPLRPEAGSAWRCAPTARCGVGGQRQRSARGRHEKAAREAG